MLKRIFLLISLVVVVFTACSTKSDEEKFQDIEKSLMASVKDLTTVPGKVALTDPYVHGKIAVFTALEAKAAYEVGVYLMQPLYYRELQDNYATKPDEVGTVALVSCKTTQRGTYKDEAGKEYPAKAEDCDLTLIDRSAQAVVFKKHFDATPADKSMVLANSVSTQSSQKDIAAFLKDLPKK